MNKQKHGESGLGLLHCQIIFPSLTSRLLLQPKRSFAWRTNRVSSSSAFPRSQHTHTHTHTPFSPTHTEAKPPLPHTHPTAKRTPIPNPGTSAPPATLREPSSLLLRRNLGIKITDEPLERCPSRSSSPSALLLLTRSG